MRPAPLPLAAPSEGSWLVAFALPSERRLPHRIVTLNTTAVALALAHAAPRARLQIIDDDANATRSARDELPRFAGADRIKVLDTTVAASTTLLDAGAADLVVAAGYEPDDFAGILRVSRHLLGRRARLCLALPASLFPAVLAGLAAQRLAAKRLRLLHPRLVDPATFVLVEALVARPGGLVVEAPGVESLDAEGAKEASFPSLDASLRTKETM